MSQLKYMHAQPARKEFSTHVVEVGIEAEGRCDELSITIIKLKETFTNVINVQVIY